MNLYIYNTLTREKEKFIPFFDEWKKDFVWIYTCGPTVYSDPHFWNLRAFVFAWLLWDIIRNILNYPLKHVVNITDVWHLTDDADSWQDKMEKWAIREWLTAWDIAKKYEKNFINYINKLELNFDFFPKATDYIQEQIDLIKSLEEKGFVYKINNDWMYMDTSKIDDYGKLMWENYEKHILWIESWARISNDNKKNITDFALWKFSKRWEKRHMERNSPWWLWFPWWHIECSAMSKAILWKNFDIHTWWIDHITTHHTNEIAQSECSFVSDKPWVKYWMHSQFLNFDGKKLSKSSWDTLSIPDLEKKWYTVYDLRYFYFTAQYRNSLKFNWDAIHKAYITKRNLVNKLWANPRSTSVQMSTWDIKEIEKNLQTKEAKIFLKNILNCLLDDLNTPRLLSILNKDVDKLNVESLNLFAWFDLNIFKFGLFKDLINKKENLDKMPIPYFITQIAQERRKAKLERDYKKADEFRNKLSEQWYFVKDYKDTYIVYHKLDY